MGYLNFALCALTTFAFIKTGESLQCWTCSSDMDAPCSDYFNTSTYRRSQFYSNQQYPNQFSNNQISLQMCELPRQSFSAAASKPVCLKKKQTTYGRTSYIRSCRYIHPSESVGTCPQEPTSSSTTVDFCEYCDYDGCNGASSQQTTIFLSLFVPLFLLFVAKK